MQKYNFVVIQPNNSPSSTLFSGMFLHIRKSLCHATRCGKPFFSRKGQAIPADVDMGKTTRICNAEGAGEPSPQQKKDRRFHGGSDMKRGSGTVILLHMHYVGRSFRLLNPLYVRSCVFGAFFRQKISPYGNFLPETEGKTRRPAGTGEL